MVKIPRLRNKNNKGFTLVELIIVLVILAILAAFSIPAYLGYVAHSKEVLCTTQRQDMTRLFKNNVFLNPSVTIKQFLQDNWGNAGCPAGGKYYMYADTSDVNAPMAYIYCDKHDGVGDLSIFIATCRMTDKYYEIMNSDMSNKEKEDAIKELLGVTNLNFSNDSFRAKVYEENGGKWEEVSASLLNRTVGLKDQTLYIQPYVAPQKEDGSRDVILFANGNNSTGGNWYNIKLVFNPENGKWYEAYDKVSLENVAGFKDNPNAWQDVKNQISDTTRWRVVE